MDTILQIDCDSWKEWHDEKGWVSYFQDLLIIIIEHFKITNNVELSILLTDDEHMESLNFSFRKKNQPTNVLSFPQTNLQEILYTHDEKNILLGDIVMSYSIISKESENQNKLFIHHVTHLFIHGVLHLLGFDHENEEEAKEMEDLEIQFLAVKNINNPYQ